MVGGHTVNAVKRLPPLAPESQNPVCAMCSGVTGWGDDDRFHCDTCRVSWPIDSYWHTDGEWDDAEAAQCNATVAPWKGSLRYPALATVVEHCLLTVGHDPGRHRSGQHVWDPDDADGYRLTDAERLALVPSALSMALAEHIAAEIRATAEAALGIPPS